MEFSYGNIGDVRDILTFESTIIDFGKAGMVKN